MMALALQEARQCRPVDGAFSVGCVIAQEDRVVASGFSREMPDNTHAEECALAKVTDGHGLTLYTTMEPCVRRLSGKSSCVDRIIASGRIARVVACCPEPPTFVPGNDAATRLATAGIPMDTDPTLAHECNLLQSHLRH